MSLLEYAFGTGDGDPHTWVSEADLDLGDPGAPDAVVLDFDGDGLLDDALWDSDGDGCVDRSVLDVGTQAARYFTDPSGLGTWDREVSAGPEAPAPDGWWWGADRHTLLVDEDLDGRADTSLSDTDGDGRLDTVRRHHQSTGTPDA
ncbi:hypothetical protein [Rhodococcus sp. NPDC127528]|uniref:hypothetical protein n=1 Tax=unclassified Rhodococcus (in: high G+C Gram-positive bacteria) TaxID=192944 RepID=UPI0036410D62